MVSEAYAKSEVIRRAEQVLILVLVEDGLRDNPADPEVLEKLS